MQSDPPRGFAVFATALGFSGFVWSGCALEAVQLPEATESEAIARILHRFPDAHRCPPPPALRQTTRRIARSLEGRRGEFDDVAIDMTLLPAFHCRVYKIVRTIPAGSTLSYGEVAALAGAPGAARAVGNALAQNPLAIVVPCHRVIGAGHRIGGYSGPGGITTKRRLLALEGVWFNGELSAAHDINPTNHRSRPIRRDPQETP